MVRGGTSDRTRLEAAPWPYLRIDDAAKRLGVSWQFLEGLCNNGIRAFDATRESGQHRRFWLLNRDDVLALKQRMEAQGG